MVHEGDVGEGVVLRDLSLIVGKACEEGRREVRQLEGSKGKMAKINHMMAVEIVGLFLNLAWTRTLRTSLTQ